jgi:hypothetical protein
MRPAYPHRTARKRMQHWLDNAGVEYDENASTAELAELAGCTYKPIRKVKEWTSTAWRVMKAVMVVLGLCQAVGFTSFIWEETSQCAGFAVKNAIDTRDSQIAAACLERFHHVTYAACGWQSWFGWACPWMHGAFTAYFNHAATAQLASYYALGVEKGLWAEDWARMQNGVNTWQFEKAIERAAKAAANVEAKTYGGHAK